MDFVNVIKSRDGSKIQQILEEFITQNAKSFTFQSMDTCSIQTEVWNSLFELLKDEEFSSCHSHCLQMLKILSRDQQHLDKIVTDSFINLLVEKANLSLQKSTNLPEQFVGILEAQKCIFNLVFSHLKSRTLVSETSIAEAILLRLSVEKSSNIPHDVLLFDLKILFLLTALCSDCRPTLRYSLHGIKHLTKYLEQCCTVHGLDHLDGNTAELCCECLKIIFNLLLSNEKSIDLPNEDYDDLQLQRDLMKIIRQFLLANSNALAKKEELKSHAINLLTSMSFESYEDLIPACANSEDCFQGCDITALVVLLEFLEERLGKPIRVLQEELLPVLSVLIQFSRTNRIARKFIRSRVLPPLRDVMHRPEEGDTIRSKLCRLMTSSSTQVEFLVAEFLFVLCKENVSRLIKYTGYGNAAGLLAHRGLMMGHPPSHVSAYSSDSEDSGTEEYKQVEHSINPVTGSYEPQRPNPLENMSEEQKEYEAVKLVNMIDQLQRKGIIQPARVGEDGKPRAIEHVMELQKD
ncbi:synembryn-A-like [Daphnia pulicaria]|uniref:synembryn-A-like n=1 Tax=Daphnia pulicaria TaxID=35523 RepID=UPI001EEAC904|nr:synembryn-A-like [Daphnia pulicaria]